MKTSLMRMSATLAAMLVCGTAFAAGGELGAVDKQPTNWVAISMFAVFVIATLWITKWAAGRTRSRSGSVRKCVTMSVTITIWSCLGI